MSVHRLVPAEYPELEGFLDTDCCDPWRVQDGSLPIAASEHLAELPSSRPTDWQAFERDIACLLPPAECLPTACSSPIQTHTAKVPQVSLCARRAEVQNDVDTQLRPDACSLRQYRAKAEQLKIKARGDINLISRAAFENLALSYLVLADHEAKRQLGLKEKAWTHIARENGWHCTCGRPIPYRDRELYFHSNLCSFCYRR